MPSTNASVAVAAAISRAEIRNSIEGLYAGVEVGTWVEDGYYGGGLSLATGQSAGKYAAERATEINASRSEVPTELRVTSRNARPMIRPRRRSTTQMSQHIPTFFTERRIAFHHQNLRL